MKTLGLTICLLLLGTTLFSTGIKVGLTTDAPAYKQYNSEMGPGVAVGDGEEYEIMLPRLNRSSAVDAFDSDAIEIGVVLGGLLSTLTGDFSDEHGSLGGFMFGIYAFYVINEMFTLMPELYYAGKGSKDKEYDSKFRLGYLMLPIVLYYKFNEQFMAGLGPYFGFLLSAKDKGDGFNEDVKDHVNGFDFGVKISAVYQATSFLAISLAFTKGFSNLPSSGNYDNFNQAFILAAYYNLQHITNK